MYKVVIGAWGVGIGQLSMGVSTDTVVEVVGIAGSGTLEFGTEESADLFVAVGWLQGIDVVIGGR